MDGGRHERCGSLGMAFDVQEWPRSMSVSTITLFDGAVITEIDVLPASASRGL
jgi:hypothetical protein